MQGRGGSHNSDVLSYFRSPCCNVELFRGLWGLVPSCLPSWDAALANASPVSCCLEIEDHVEYLH